MSIWPQVTYLYDGSFAGFLCCVGESFRTREYPFYFFLPQDDQASLYPLREIQTDQALARQVYGQLKQKLSSEGRQLVEYGFLTCLPRRERHIYDFIYAQLYAGANMDPTDARVLILSKAVRQLIHEAQLFQGFVRFSDYSGMLVGEISPKNRVLPLLRPHFCDRFGKERFLLHDRSHKEALFYGEGRWKILPLDALHLDAPEEKETRMRSLWRQFYEEVSIESRLNPKLRQSHMPKRYWKHLTELS